MTQFNLMEMVIFKEQINKKYVPKYKSSILHFYMYEYLKKQVMGNTVLNKFSKSLKNEVIDRDLQTISIDG